jgi:phospholipase C
MRRRLVAALGALTLATASWVFAAPAAAAPRFPAAEDLETTTPIKHFMVLMQENHSFDNYFGTYPGADGIPEGTCMPVDPVNLPATECIEPHHLEEQAITDLGHNSDVFAAEFNNGKMDGFVSAFADQPTVGDRAMGYYDDRDLPFYWNIADNYVLFDRLFTSAATGSVGNHFFWTTATPGTPDADRLLAGGFDHLTTIFDRLQAAGVSWKFYVQNYRPNVNFRTATTGIAESSAQLIWVPLLSFNRFLDDPALNERIVDMSEYYKDAAAGTLPAVSFMVPFGASEHPPGSIQAGERFVRSLISALMSSPNWEQSAFMWAYDDWGGWYDHVAPPAVDQFGYGFRSPALLVSPYAKPGHIDHTTLDFTSQLKFIENNWGVEPLAERDRNANDIVSAFDFSAAPREPVLLDRARDPAGPPDSRSGVVYLCYGAALIAAPVFAAVNRRRGRPREEAGT